MKIQVLKKEDGYWLSLSGKKNALIALGEHGPIVMDALEEASKNCICCGRTTNSASGYCFQHSDMAKSAQQGV